MAPAFLRSLRRRSKASIRAEQQSSTDDSSEGGGTNSQGTGPSSGSATPASIAQQSDPALNLQIKDSASSGHGSPSTAPVRPPIAPVPNTNRHSVSGMSGLGAPSIYGRQTLPVSQYAPRIHNAQDGIFVYQKVLLVHGTIGDAQNPIDGTLTVTKLDDEFPPVSWPVSSSYFKALVYLQPGPNKIRFEFSSPKIPNSATSNPIHASYMTVHMIPPLSTPPLHLAILLGKDSPGLYDATPARIEAEGNGLETAIKKFRMAAYLWQAFTAEQMWRHKLGRRTFRFDDEWTTGSVNFRDRANGTMRSEAKVHIIRSDKTVAEIRDLNRAQQYGEATDKGALFDIAGEAVRKHFPSLPGQKQYVTVLLMDAHWDKEHKTITGHAALGGGGGDLQLAIFGSHCLHSYPSTLEEVVPAFTDCTPTDTNYVANDCNESGSSWEAANIGIGAHLHEVGHLFGCPHQEAGVMLRDYVVLNRTFVTREAYSTRTKSKGGLCLQGDECGWHRLDALRFRSHPAFRLPNDPPAHPDGSVQAYPAEGGNALLVAAASGVSFVEIYAEGEDLCHTWLEFGPDAAITGQRQVTLAEQDLRARLPQNKKKGVIRLAIKSHGGGNLDIADFKQFVSAGSAVKIEGGKQSAIRSIKVGNSALDGSQPQDVVFTSATRQDRVLSRVNVFHGLGLDGMEFVYDDGSSQQFGKKGGKPGGSSFDLDVRRGEVIAGFYVRAGAWVDGIQILTSLGRKSEVFGQAHGGSPHTLIPPRGYSICGVSGTCGAWVDGFSILIKR
ncbi:putative peptidase family [Geosmithia morbida]|uniref:Peptidase family n=1 Tax=Geosmithia morbida TaxID=1094350 RepID=A0A9P4YTJ3_9HYPO|nr:putative peptidase family [Geosmithia morbida]KAF4121537.1 putative peptidase family [Geosmithia morbida]